jgi:hypothetical protein
MYNLSWIVTLHTLQVPTEIIGIQELKLTSIISIVHTWIQKCIIYLSVNFKLDFSIQLLVNRTLHVPPEKWRKLLSNVCNVTIHERLYIFAC